MFSIFNSPSLLHPLSLCFCCFAVAAFGLPLPPFSSFLQQPLSFLAVIKNFPFLPRNTERVSVWLCVCVCVRVYLCVCVDTKFSSSFFYIYIYIYFPFCSSSLLLLPRLGISVYFFEKKIYVKRSGSNWQRCRHQQRQWQRRSVDCAGKIVADAVAVSFTESKNKTAESQSMLPATCPTPLGTFHLPPSIASFPLIAYLNVIHSVLLLPQDGGRR